MKTLQSSLNASLRPEAKPDIAEGWDDEEEEDWGAIDESPPPAVPASTSPHCHTSHSQLLAEWEGERGPAVGWNWDLLPSTQPAFWWRR